MATPEVPNAETEQQEEVVKVVLSSSKPLHRFAQEDTYSVGIVVLMFGCAEILMAFQVTNLFSSYARSVSFVQGALFLVCGILSIHAVHHPSKKIVTACLAMYGVTLIEIIFTTCVRAHTFLDNIFLYSSSEMLHFYAHRIGGIIEGTLSVCALFVFAILIFLATVARKALKSTKTQAVIKHIIPAMAPATISTE